MPVIPLIGTRRDSIGKGAARKVRAAGQIPGVLYGHGQTPVALNVSARDFELAVRKKGGNPIIGLTLDEGRTGSLRIFRLAESVSAIVVSDRVRAAIESASIEGMYFYEAGEWSG